MVHLAKTRTTQRILAIVAIVLLACACIILASNLCTSQSRQSNQAFTSVNDSQTYELEPAAIIGEGSSTAQAEGGAQSSSTAQDEGGAQSSSTAQDEGGTQSASSTDSTSDSSSTMREKLELPTESLG